MKKILSLFVVIGLLTILIGCELSHIKSQFKKDSSWLSEDDLISFKMEGPSTRLAYGVIKANALDNKVILKVSDDGDRISAYLNVEETMVLWIDFKLDVFTENKKFVSDKIILTVLENNSDDITFDTYQTVIERSIISEVNPINYLGVNYYNEEFGIKLTYSDLLYYLNSYDLFINDRPKNIIGTFKFTPNNTFEMYQENKLILTGIYHFDEKQLTLSFGTNDLYQDTNSIVLSFS